MQIIGFAKQIGDIADGASACSNSAPWRCC
jgi:hypothetical protein